MVTCTPPAPMSDFLSDRHQTMAHAVVRRPVWLRTTRGGVVTDAGPPAPPHAVQRMP